MQEEQLVCQVQNKIIYLNFQTLSYVKIMTIEWNKSKLIHI